MKIERNSRACHISTHNQMLAALSEGSRVQLMPFILHEVVNVGEVLCEPWQMLDKIYFPQDCLISVLAIAKQKMALEVALIGSEGVLGASPGLSMDVAHIRAVVQKSGTCACIRRPDFYEQCKNNPELRQMLYRYTDGMLAQIRQIALCSHYHLLEARLARSLLTTRDRLQSDRFHITHENMANALGVRRVGVTKAATALQNQKLISYSRGNIVILDPEGLRDVCCSCYQEIKDAGSRVLSDSYALPPASAPASSISTI